jgi:DNA modification methylase
MIHLSPWQSAPWPEQVDCIITDPPYSERTHSGNNAGRRETRSRAHEAKPNAPSANKPIRQIDYDHLEPDTARQWGESWGRRVSAWCAVMCDHTLIPAWIAGLEAAGLYAFAPIPCVITGMTCRLTGDGPSSWAVYLVVGRTRQANKWGTLPGAYVVSQSTGEAKGKGSRIGGKPLPLMQQIIRDYSRPGMLVADPCAGHGTTLVAAKGAGRLVWGAECDPAAHRAACERLDAVQVPTLIPPDRSRQSNLL